MGKGEISKKERGRAVYELRKKHPLTDLLAAAGTARSTYYYMLKQFDKPEAYKEEKEFTGYLFHENKGRYGYRRMTQALKKRGMIMNHKAIWQIMKELGLACKMRRHHYRSY